MFSTIRKAVSRMEERAELSRGPTYEQARAELGGAPWREVPKSTDAWYILDDEAVALPAPAEPKRLRVAVVAGAVVAGAALLFCVARSHAHEGPPPPAAIAATPSLAPAPSPAAPAAVAVPAPVKHAAHARPHHQKLQKHARR